MSEIAFKKALYSGKAKTIFQTDRADQVILHFRDDTSAFDGERIESLTGKGVINNHINAFIMTRLQSEGIPCHFIKKLNHTDSLVQRLQMIPVESVVRNYSAGGLSKRFGIIEGRALTPATHEFFMKNDKLHDPMLNDSLIQAFELASLAEIEQMKFLSQKVNNILQPLFDEAGCMLIDFKLEFGRFQGELVLGDEFTPDGCRIWDKATQEKLDKDRFRRNLGQVLESYTELARRIGVVLP